MFLNGLAMEPPVCTVQGEGMLGHERTHLIKLWLEFDGGPSVAAERSRMETPAKTMVVIPPEGEVRSESTHVRN